MQPPSERFGRCPREREIVIQVARGRLSKQIAGDIGIAEATVKVHRSRAMWKLKARSLPNSAGWRTSSNLYQTSCNPKPHTSAYILRHLPARACKAPLLQACYADKTGHGTDRLQSRLVCLDSVPAPADDFRQEELHDDHHHYCF